MRLVDRIRQSEIEDPALDEYLSACESYYRRQLLADQHKPQRTYSSWSEETGAQFVDPNT